jgi:hypothetical protein
MGYVVPILGKTGFFSGSQIQILEAVRENLVGGRFGAPNPDTCL